jgi:hypothetical protein
MTELERCDYEIAEIERQLRSGHHDVEGLCLSLSDWSAEKRLVISRSDDGSKIEVIEAFSTRDG